MANEMARNDKAALWGRRLGGPYRRSNHEPHINFFFFLDNFWITEPVGGGGGSALKPQEAPFCGARLITMSVWNNRGIRKRRASPEGNSDAAVSSAK
jgi:hypothetical protein